MQAGDLRRLLELYQLWAKKHFPRHTFYEVVENLEDLGRSHRIKACPCLPARTWTQSGTAPEGAGPHGPAMQGTTMHAVPHGSAMVSAPRKADLIDADSKHDARDRLNCMS